MLIVAGTKRSGTSMWMQVLAAAGYPVIGEAFPSVWKESIGDANPGGFYESSLRRGINSETNPEPRTGFYLHPAETVHHAVKVFSGGLVRTDHTFLHRVIVTVRHWREYAASIARLEAMETEHKDATLPASVVPDQRVQTQAALEWWLENYLALRDAFIRRYPANFIAYDTVVEAPGECIPQILEWIGEAKDVDAAVAAVVPEHRTQHRDEAEDIPGLDDEIVAGFDEFYDRIVNNRGFDRDALERMNAVQARLVPRLEAQLREVELQRRFGNP